MILIVGRDRKSGSCAMRYSLTSIKCGNDKMAGMWVSIGYRSKDRHEHVLHIVGGEEKSAQPVGRTLVPIYFERDDQSLSCYEAADNILVTEKSVVLTLNKNGRVSLELPKTVELVSEKAGRDFKKARTMFMEMQKRHSGEVIHVANWTVQRTGASRSARKKDQTSSAAGSHRLPYR
jgi:hypothetical protein